MNRARGKGCTFDKYSGRAFSSLLFFGVWCDEILRKDTICSLYFTTRMEHGCREEEKRKKMGNHCVLIKCKFSIHSRWNYGYDKLKLIRCSEFATFNSNLCVQKFVLNWEEHSTMLHEFTRERICSSAFTIKWCDANISFINQIT